jgi:hypothetical protein
MVFTTDVPEAIRQKLYDNWRLHGNLDKKHVDFNTGETAPSRKYPSIEVVTIGDTPKVLTAEWLQLDHLAHVHVWVRPRTTEKDALAQAKNNRKYMLQEVRRILHLYQTTVEDIQWVYFENEICADQYFAIDDDILRSQKSSAAASRAGFPILHSILPVRAREFRNAIVGGIQVNR